MVKGKAEINTLPIDEVAVQERSVTIRVLTVGTKQITLALYKQLQQDNSSLFDWDTGILSDDAVIWGWVNVCTPLCQGSIDTHLHVIYEESGCLKKARVSRSFDGPDTIGREIQDELRRARYNRDNEGIAELEAQHREYKAIWMQTFQAIEDAGQIFIAVSGVWK